MADVNQSVISDIVSLHLWPKSRDGKRIGLAMTVFIFFPLAFRLPFLIASPVPTTRWTSTDSNNTAYKEWASKTGLDLQTASIFLLLSWSSACSSSKICGWQKLSQSFQSTPHQIIEHINKVTRLVSQCALIIYFVHFTSNVRVH